MGILFAVGALFAWGVGDFLIQRSIWSMGLWIALFYITAFGSIVLFPFVYKDLGVIADHRTFFLFFGASIVLFFAAYFEFESLRVGKISIIEPVYCIEIPIATILASFVLREFMTLWQTIFTAVLLCGIVLVSIRSKESLKNIRWEKGVRYALLGASGMGAVDFFFGLNSRIANPLLINWFADVFLTVASLFFIFARSQQYKIFEGWRENKRLILGVSLLDKLAWVSFSYSMLYIPIGVATGISQSYVALTATLGIILNRERLKNHQLAGLTLAIIGVILLSLATNR